MVAAGIRVPEAQDGQHGGVPFPGQLRGGEQRGCLDAEERHEDRPLAAEIHVRQVVDGPGRAQVTDQFAHAVLAADLEHLVEAGPSGGNDRIDAGIALRRVHGGGAGQLQRQPGGGGVQPDEVRRQQNHGAALGNQRVDLLRASLGHQVFDGLGRAVPKHAAIHDGLGQCAEVVGRHALADCLGLIRETQGKIAADDVRARFGQPQPQPAQAGADALPGGGPHAGKPLQQGNQCARFEISHGMRGWAGPRQVRRIQPAVDAVSAPGAGGAPRGVLYRL
ncbi:hypothetical protein D3C85_794360 [compost metagenome]